LQRQKPWWRSTTIGCISATDWAQVLSAVFTAAAALAAFLAVRNAQQQNRTARESITAQLEAAERAAVLARKPVLVSSTIPREGRGLCATSAKDLL
jgi:type VI protein secretion system component VasK